MAHLSLQKIKITIFLTLLTSIAAIAFTSSVNDVLANIQDVSNHISALHEALSAFPDTGGSATSAWVHLVHIIPLCPLLIYSWVGSLLAANNKKITDINVSFFFSLLTEPPHFI